MLLSSMKKSRKLSLTVDNRKSPLICLYKFHYMKWAVRAAVQLDYRVCVFVFVCGSVCA